MYVPICDDDVFHVKHSSPLDITGKTWREGHKWGKPELTPSLLNTGWPTFVPSQVGLRHPHAISTVSDTKFAAGNFQPRLPLLISFFLLSPPISGSRSSKFHKAHQQKIDFRTSFSLPSINTPTHEVRRQTT